MHALKISQLNQKRVFISHPRAEDFPLPSDRELSAVLNEVRARKLKCWRQSEDFILNKHKECKITARAFIPPHNFPCTHRINLIFLASFHKRQIIAAEKVTDTVFRTTMPHLEHAPVYSALYIACLESLPCFLISGSNLTLLFRRVRRIL